MRKLQLLLREGIVKGLQRLLESLDSYDTIHVKETVHHLQQH